MTTVTFICLTVVEGLFAGVSLTPSQGLVSTGAKVRSVSDLFQVSACNHPYKKGGRLQLCLCLWSFFHLSIAIN